ncbi:hypothetical protein DFH07DRAFT_780529 [Mycena maculata]|uniref:Uncharacterized protein n=1 Tax=Mycena maculata TaxID=230809 RepID=A0AAD7I2N0_9AGAR|nr:hypothetical protein DFH07DRAFT_780529 [Mycena maculata]
MPCGCSLTQIHRITFNIPAVEPLLRVLCLLDRGSGAPEELVNGFPRIDIASGISLMYMYHLSRILLYLLWTPRLRPYKEDAAVLQEKAFAKACVTFHDQPRTRKGGSELLQLLDETLSEPCWVRIAATVFSQVQFLSDWLPYCIGSELVDKMPGDAIIRSRQLFLDVLWTWGVHKGSTEGDSLTLDMLLKAQMQNFRAYGQIPADFCWIDDVERRDTWDGDSDAGQRDSDWEECPWEEEEEGNFMDEDFDPDYIYLPEPMNFVQSPAKPVVSVLPGKPRRAPASDGDELPFQWATHICQFFFPEKEEMSGDKGEEAEERSAWDVVDDLVHMHLLKAPHYTRKFFQIALEMWNRASAGIIGRLLIPKQTLPVPNPDYVFTLKEAMELFQFMSAHPRMLPWSFNPMAVFFLLSAECFAVNCETWLVPCLHELEYPCLDGWNSKRVYQRITSMGVFLAPHLHASFLNGLDPRLALIIQETVNHRTSLHRISREVFRTPNPKPSSEFGDGYESSEASDFDVSDSDSKPKTKQKKKKKNSDNGEVKVMRRTRC